MGQTQKRTLRTVLKGERKNVAAFQPFDGAMANVSISLGYWHEGRRGRSTLFYSGPYPWCWGNDPGHVNDFFVTMKGWYRRKWA